MHHRVVNCRKLINKITNLKKNTHHRAINCRKLITKITNFNKVRCMQNNIYFQATTIINYNLSLSKWKTKYNINKHFSNVTFGRQNIYKSLLLNRSKDFWLGTKVLPRVDSLLSFDPSISPITSSIS